MRVAREHRWVVCILVRIDRKLYDGTSCYLGFFLYRNIGSFRSPIYDTAVCLYSKSYTGCNYYCCCRIYGRGQGHQADVAQQE